MTTLLEDLRNAQEELVRKPLDGAVFRADLSAAHIDAATLFAAAAVGPPVVEAGELKTLPTGYNDQGLLSTDGYSFGREVQSQNIGAFGRTTPVRTDISGDTDSFSFVAIETNIETIALGTGAVLTPTSRSATTGALEIKKPTKPKPRTYHWLTVAQDENEFGEIYICRYLPRGKITAYGDQAFGSGEEPIGWNVTVTGENDSTWGSPGSWLFGGPGWVGLLEAMGFDPLT